MFFLRGYANLVLLHDFHINESYFFLNGNTLWQLFSCNEYYLIILKIKYFRLSGEFLDDIPSKTMGLQSLNLEQVPNIDVHQILDLLEWNPRLYIKVIFILFRKKYIFFKTYLMQWYGFIKK